MGKSMEVLDWNEFFSKSGGLKKEDEKQTKKVEIKQAIKKTAVTTTLTFIALPYVLNTLGITPDFGLISYNPVLDTSGLLVDADGAVAVATTKTVDGWSLLINKIITIADYLADGVIIFSGALWLFGHRTKAIELLFGTAVGYNIIRHHETIKQFFTLI